MKTREEMTIEERRQAWKDRQLNRTENALARLVILQQVNKQLKAELNK